MSKRILIIDDDYTIRLKVENVLTVHGYDVVTAEDGEKAIACYVEAVAANPFHLIILDIMMPGMSGLEVLKEIRQEEESRGIEYGRGYSVPILMLTGTKKLWLDAFDSGCDDYLLKPFANDDLLDKVGQRLP